MGVSYIILKDKKNFVKQFYTKVPIFVIKNQLQTQLVANVFC